MGFVFIPADGQNRAGLFAEAAALALVVQNYKRSKSGTDSRRACFIIQMGFVFRTEIFYGG